MNNNSSKQILLSVIGVAILVVAVVGVSFAFFYFTDTSSEQTITTGTITFTASTSLVDLGSTLVWPTNSSAATTVATVTINGNTNYAGGISYYIYAEDLANTIGVPVTVVASGDSALTSSGNAFATKTTVLTAAAQQLIGQGTIASGSNVASAKVTIKAFVNAANVLITSGNPADIPAEIKTGKTVVTDTAWNGKTLSFKIRVVATQTGSTIDPTI